MPPKLPKTDAQNAEPHFQHPQGQSSSNPAQGQVVSVNDDKEAQFITLSNQVAQIRSTRINLNTDIIGLFETVSTIPTGVPTGPWQQIKFYSNATTYRLYMYDATNNVWRYSTLT